MGRKQMIGPVTLHVAARTLFVAPTGSRKLFVFIERFPGSAPGISCVAQLGKEWREDHGGITWYSEWHQYGEQFLQEANLKAFAVRRSVSRRTHGSAVESAGQLSYELRAERRRFLSRDLKERLLKEPAAAASHFGLAPLDEDLTVLQLQRGEESKTYVVEKGGFPKVQIDLGEGLSDVEFVAECEKHLRELVDVQWDKNWCSI